MPKRSNWFQKLILAIESNLASQGATVTESAMLKDALINEYREVDILIEASSGRHKLTIGVECVGGANRPADVTWVEKIACKHKHLAIDKSVLVSKTGFSSSALKKASALRLEALSLDEALNLDWKPKLDEWPATIRVVYPKPLSARIFLELENPDDRPLLEQSGDLLAESILYNESGSSLGTVSEVVLGALNRDEVQAIIGQYPVPEMTNVYALPIELLDAQRSFVVTENQIKIPFTKIRVLGFVSLKEESVPWAQASYGDAAVRHMTVPVGTNTATIVVTETNQNGPTARIVLANPAERAMTFILELAPAQSSTRTARES